MRTTIWIDDDLYRLIEARSSLTGRTVSELIEDAVRESLRPKPREVVDERTLPVFGGSGVLPGIDLSDSASLLDR